MGFWLWYINSACFFDFHMWRCHFMCLARVLRSPQCLIKCSRWCFVSHILWWEGDPTTGVSIQILGGITPTQFYPLYRTPGVFIFSYFRNLWTPKTSQILKFSRLPKSLDLREARKVTLVFIFVSFHVPMLFYSWRVSSAFYSLLLF